MAIICCALKIDDGEIKQHGDNERRGEMERRWIRVRE